MGPGEAILIEGSYEALAPNESRPRRVSELFVILVPDVLLVGSGGLPIALTEGGGGRIIIEPVSSPRGTIYLPALQRAAAEVGLVRLLVLLWAPRRVMRSAEVRRTDAAVHAITRAGPHPGESQYGHWMLEHAGQVLAAKSVSDRLPQDFVYVTNGKVAPFQTQTFERLGVCAERIVPHSNGLLIFDRLIVVSLRNAHSRRSEFDPRAAQRLRAALTGGDAIANAPEEELGMVSPRVAAVMRDDDSHRRITNRAEIDEVLRGVGAVILGSDSVLAEEVDLLKRCEVLIGVFGAGLAKMVLCPRLRAVIELAPPPPLGRPPFDVYERLSAGLGVHDQRIVGSVSGPGTRRGKNADFVIQRGDVDAALRQALMEAVEVEGATETSG